ncbi:MULTISPECIES: helix-turn-helix domain-containing protein [Enterobacteriaceae]|uniref:helix-turn-helix domain-containing protein n=1 Tax=Enterobacteriaceae TaxID=543 RepID=UPI0003312EA6|nr:MULTISPECIES: helix-turn-helix transcriptional regulator [Enterobacteriaceae]EEX2875341.1 XRE family transcriptional regulator [Escherichia coli]HBM7610057.1 helix-turn-helix transcriptional regulator [Enterobacter asburiae]HDR2458467.1 helix-turn-helix transcriptional regulator [Enterobacter ludwigii]EFO4321330.1 helix-turn-helix transcriptional regulator [Escherichia coli]EGT0627546.1 helix-turn-helix transcriptional regulator [Citrobacter freundii]
MANIQFITDSRGQRISAVVPIELFEKLTRDSDIAELYEPVQNETGTSDNVRYPNEVINILSEKGCTMQAAWRVYRGLTQKQVAEALGIKQSTVSEFEKSERPRKDNLERLATLYKCSPEQLTLE